MRALILLLLTAAALPAAHAQEPADCDVVSRPAEVTPEGRLEYPPASSEECEAAARVEQKLADADPERFRALGRLRQLPDEVLAHLGPMAERWEAFDTGGIAGRTPPQRHIESYRSGDLVVVIFERRSIGGAVMQALLADVETLTACFYPEWPQTTSRIEDVQRVVEDGLVCHLRSLID